MQEKLVVKVISTDEHILLEMARQEKRILSQLKELAQVAQIVDYFEYP